MANLASPTKVPDGSHRLHVPRRNRRNDGAMVVLSGTHLVRGGPPNGRAVSRRGPPSSRLLLEK